MTMEAVKVRVNAVCATLSTLPGQRSVAFALPGGGLNLELEILLDFLLSRVDVFYTLRWDADTHMPFFKGFHKTTISYDENSEAWTLASEDDSVIGRSLGPIGIAMGTELMDWTFESPVCQASPPGNFNLKLILTVCSPQQFTCHSDGEQQVST